MRSQRRAFPGWQLGMLAVMLLAVGAMLGHPANAQNSGSAETVAVQPESPASAALPADEGELIPTRDVWEIMQKGGLLMWPIAFCSLVFVAFFFERLVSLRRGRIIPKPFVTRFLSQLREGELDREQALRLCEENGSPVSQVFAGAVRKWGRPAVEVEQAVIDAGERATNGLRRYLRVFNTVATVTPLLGLLGTVVGMIRAFNSVAASDALGR
ncbi:MAG: MotA/TolQ/ExbB proton channel family protein, partial [Thermoguttaceae bacterium]|nr:MotA/TolQ/ExbB proton channel family protein [Thermoguttaceae bacterium]